MVNSGKRQVAICLDKGALFVLVVIWTPSCSGQIIVTGVVDPSRGFGKVEENL